jgi:uncharacterized protein
MSSGLIALLDDVAAIAKVAAASLDDVAAATGKASSKAAGIVIDDTAVTPRYVVGFTPDRELPIIAKIAKGSLRNKLLFLLPACLALSYFAPWAITPLLMIGGAFLCFEAAEKLLEALGLGHHADADADDGALDAAALEAQKVSGAIRTDLILSAEIMAITLGQLAGQSLVMQAVVLAVVGIVITVGVYGLVALIVKMDDIGLHMAQRRLASTRAIGRALVTGMPKLLSLLSVVGTAAMAWVGGGIVLHGMAHFGLTAPEHTIHSVADLITAPLPVFTGFAHWLVSATGAGIAGLIIGAAIVGMISLARRAKA